MTRTHFALVLMIVIVSQFSAQVKRTEYFPLRDNWEHRKPAKLAWMAPG